jgi:hypothetical protein
MMHPGGNMKQLKRFGVFSAVVITAMWMMVGGVHAHTVDAADVLDPAKHPRATEQVPDNSTTDSSFDPGPFQDPLERLTQIITDGFRKATGFIDEARLAFDASARVEANIRQRKMLAAWGRSLGEVARSLSSATIAMPEPGKTFQACKDIPGRLAYVMTGGSTIYLCPRALDGTYSDKGLGQILVHESAHVSGIYDECGATQIEVQTMYRTQAGLQFKNGYWDRCGLTAASSLPAASAESLAIEP